VTPLPVIGVPIAVGELGDSIRCWPWCRCPRGSCRHRRRQRGGNAGLLAVRILALSDERLSAALVRHRDDMATKVRKTDEEIRTRFEK